MSKLKNLLLIISGGYLLFHMYRFGFTFVNVSAFILFLFSVSMNLYIFWKGLKTTPSEKQTPLKEKGKNPGKPG